MLLASKKPSKSRFQGTVTRSERAAGLPTPKFAQLPRRKSVTLIEILLTISRTPCRTD
nr:MAG TPA: hypothetical protein [Caudoviricetes sp.]